MSSLYPVDIDAQMDAIGQAVIDSRRVTATWRRKDGWATLKTRFVGADSQAGELLLECPDASRAGGSEITEGQSVSVSFRRGRSRYVFSTVALGRGEAEDGQGGSCRTLRLLYPRELSELQRRLFHREVASPTTAIPVNLRPASDAADADSSALTGILADVSREGIGVVLPPGRRMTGEIGQILTCALHPHEGQPPIHLRARLRNQARQSDGRVRIGLRFAASGSSLDADVSERLTQFLARMRV